MIKPESLAARLLDVVLVLVGAAIASHIRFEDVTQHNIDYAFVAFSAAFALALFPAFGVYVSWRGRSKIGLAGQVSLAWITVQICSLVLMFTVHRSDFVSRLWFAYWTGSTGALMIAARVSVHRLLARVRQSGLDLRKVAVVGRGAHAAALVSKIDGCKEAGFRTAAVLDVSPEGFAVSGVARAVPEFNDLHAFATYIRAQDVHELWLALPLSEEHTIYECVKELRDDLINIRFMPDLRSLAMFESSMIDLLGVPAINLVASPLSPTSQLQKEMFDRLFAARAGFPFTVAAGDRHRDQAVFAWTGDLQAEAQRRRWPRLHHLQVSLDAYTYREARLCQSGDAPRPAGHPRRCVPAARQSGRAAAIF
jgi:FlaA1/EpsC-like NDP-sugar epimerase